MFQVGTTLSILASHKSCTPHAVRTLINTGYNVRNDEWHRKGKMPEKLASEPELKTLLQSQSDGVTSLCHICRMSIRKRLNFCHGGRTILPWLENLPLPNVLKEYLSFEQELKPT